MISRDGRIGGGGLGGSSDPPASPGVGHPAEARVDRAALGFVDLFPIACGGIFEWSCVSTGLASQKKLYTKNAGWENKKTTPACGFLIFIWVFYIIPRIQPSSKD